MTGRAQHRCGADHWSAAKACVELVHEGVEPTATGGPRRQPPHDLTDCLRGVLDRPADLVVAGAGVVGRSELAGPRSVGSRTKGVLLLLRAVLRVHERRRSGEARRACGRCCRLIGDLARRSESGQGERAQMRGPLPAVPEGPDALDGLPRAGVRGSFRLEQREHPLGAVGGPEPDLAEVFLGQRDQGPAKQGGAGGRRGMLSLPCRRQSRRLSGTSDCDGFSVSSGASLRALGPGQGSR